VANSTCQQTRLNSKPAFPKGSLVSQFGLNMLAWPISVQDLEYYSAGKSWQNYHDHFLTYEIITLGGKFMGIFDSIVKAGSSAIKAGQKKLEELNNKKEEFEIKSDEQLIKIVLSKGMFANNMLEKTAAMQLLKNRGYSSEDIKMYGN
jgi:hypothetical protein